MLYPPSFGDLKAFPGWTAFCPFLSNSTLLYFCLWINQIQNVKWFCCSVRVCNMSGVGFLVFKGWDVQSPNTTHLSFHSLPCYENRGYSDQAYLLVTMVTERWKTKKREKLSELLRGCSFTAIFSLLFHLKCVSCALYLMFCRWIQTDTNTMQSY